MAPKKKKKKKNEYSLKTFTKRCKNSIRTNFKFSDHHHDTVKNARVEEDKFNKDGSLSKAPAVFHICNMCKEKKKLDLDKMQVDHISTVVPIHRHEDEMSIQEYFDATYSTMDNLQLLCKECHVIKSTEEKIQKKPYAAERRKKKKLEKERLKNESKQKS